MWSRILDSPFVVFAISLAAQYVAAYLGDLFRKTRLSLWEDERQDFDLVRTATLTLLGLIIGFSFSMAVSRYDQRKNCEEAEANAISTEYVRADLLAAEHGATVRDLLRMYVKQRILFYETRDSRRIAQIDADTAKLQAALWSAVLHASTIQSTPVLALAVSGMNDVLNSQGYTQAAYWNRIPVAAWGLLGLIAISSNLLLGYGERRTNRGMLLILPLVISVSFFLIADIDSPRGGVIRIAPQNLIAVSKFVTGH